MLSKECWKITMRSNCSSHSIHKLSWRKKVKDKKNNKEGNLWFFVARVVYIKLILSMRHFAASLRTAHSPFLTSLSLSYSTLTFCFLRRDS